MKIIRDRATKIVRYVFSDETECTITESGMVGDVLAADIFPITHELVDQITSVPDQWIGGQWIYDGYWLRNDGKTLKQQKLTDLAAYRYEKETAGIILNGSTIKTDLESQAKINGALSLVTLNTSTIINWKSANGWIQLDAVTVTAIAFSVGTYVQSCFTAERLHSEAINNLTSVEEIVSYDFTTGWPI